MDARSDSAGALFIFLQMQKVYARSHELPTRERERETENEEKRDNALCPLVNQPKLELLARESSRDRSPKSIFTHRIRPRTGYTRASKLIFLIAGEREREREKGVINDRQIYNNVPSRVRAFNIGRALCFTRGAFGN